MSRLAPPQTVRNMPPTRRIQRACACGGHCDSCRKKKLQRQAADNARPASSGLTGLDQGGAPLPRRWRQQLEPLFGTSLADVRIHDDSASHRAARDLHANAFTWGQHVHFGAGRYRPDSSHGLHLLAHELTHTVQQRGSTPVAATDAIDVDAPDAPMEREADAAADAILAGQPIAVASSPGSTGRLQRDAIPGEAEIDHPDGSGGGVRIHRTMRDRPCDDPQRVARTQSTPSGHVFEWDQQANALRLHYTICHGSVRLTTDGDIDYSRVVDAGQRLLHTLESHPEAGATLPTLGRTAIDQASLSASGSVTLTVDGILQASVSAHATAGTAEQDIRVTGQLRITPQGVSFTITGFVDASHRPTLSANQYSLNLRVGTRWFAVNLGYQREESTPTGGPTDTRQTLHIGAEIPLPDLPGLSDLQLRPGIDIDPGNGQPQLAPGLFVHGRFGGPDRTPRVDCYTCTCPPPLPEYACTPYGQREVVDRAADTQRPALLYQYDNAQPANPTEFNSQVASIANLAGQGYTVNSIRGYASPEGAVPYNQALGLRRAEQARTAISSQLPATAGALPAAEGIGELLGESSTRPGQEARNSELTRQLVAQLSGLGPDERLDLLGVEGARRTDPIQRQQALDDIEAFVQGRDAHGRRIAGRARWERVFPFLRRVEVELHRDAATHHERVDHPEQGTGCSDADKAYIDAQRPIPDAARLPRHRCDE
ncbi:DUF4157 domain-containing protein [Dyella ginsengisoli]|uniref:eCIS core domain-containing protein n=1 Tax=Dyella ginsengisoli TaxID=363848 RepID=UPI0003482F1D|nr:DUF4157 domain-containing protein [Dyella ginsengisoli]